MRSAISKEACKLICIAAEYGQGNIDNLCEKLLSKQSLLKIINSGTKVIAENGHECIMALLKFEKCAKVIPKIIEEISSKNTSVRQKLSLYMQIIIELFDQQIIEKYQNILEEALVTFIADANKEVRQTTRQTFSIYAEKFSSRAEKMFSTFDASAQKTLIEEGLVDPNIFLKKSSSISGGTKDVKANQRPSSASAKKTEGKNMLSTQTKNISGLNGFISDKSDSEKSTPTLAKSLMTPANEEKATSTKLSNSDMFPQRKVVSSGSQLPNSAGIEKKILETSTSHLKGTIRIPVIKGKNSIGSNKSVQESMERSSFTAESKVRFKFQNFF